MKFTMTIIATVTLALAGCSTNPNVGNEANALADLPHWMIAPEVEGGIADVACVVSSGSLNIDRSEAVHLATEQLAGQLSRKVASLSKSFQSKTKTPQGLNVGSNFTQTGQQLIEQEMNGVKPLKMGIYTINAQEQLCIMVGMVADKTQSLFQQLKGASKADLDARDESVLYEKFRAYKAGEELQRVLK